MSCGVPKLTEGGGLGSGRGRGRKGEGEAGTGRFVSDGAALYRREEQGEGEARALKSRGSGPCGSHIVCFSKVAREGAQNGVWMRSKGGRKMWSIQRNRRQGLGGESDPL